MSDYDMIRREAEELIAFLRGAAPLHGCWFGERHHDRPAFWWRNELGRLERAIPAADARAERDALRAKVARLEGAGNERPDAPAHIVEYTNYRGETARRCIIPIRMWWGSNDWHPEEQWMLTAWDLDKNASRDFAWQDMRPVQNGATSAARAALTDGGKDE